MEHLIQPYQVIDYPPNTKKQMAGTTDTIYILKVLSENEQFPPLQWDILADILELPRRKIKTLLAISSFEASKMTKGRASMLLYNKVVNGCIKLPAKPLPYEDILFKYSDYFDIDKPAFRLDNRWLVLVYRHPVDVEEISEKHIKRNISIVDNIHIFDTASSTIVCIGFIKPFNTRNRKFYDLPNNPLISIRKVVRRGDYEDLIKEVTCVRLDSLFPPIVETV